MKKGFAKRLASGYSVVTGGSKSHRETACKPLPNSVSGIKNIVRCSDAVHQNHSKDLDLDFG
ncbi:hypothetical protein [Chitinophaga sp.]|uniref:hypothetical protein n=1 Tax=Chitinophaga sp. TaxID=1869181 RepID=UPI00260BCE8B|nr:hypothetical protein [uncultured Chitinophaga sp.]